MNKKEAILAMLDGRVLNWYGSVYAFRFSQSKYRFERAKKGDETLGEWESCSVNSLGGNQFFTEYQEPKKKVRFYQYEFDLERSRNWYSDCGLVYLGLSDIDKKPVPENWIKIHGAYIEVEV